jgi:signal transduction histidine kinase
VRSLHSNLAAIVATAIVYYITGKLGLRMAFLHASATPVWPPTGIALAALLLIGYRVWPGVFLGAFLVNITTVGSWASTLGIATGNTLEGVIGANLVWRFANGPRAFERSQDILKLWFLAGMVSTTVAATLGVTSLCLTGFAEWANYGSIWITWWLGDATGSFMVGSVLILWATPYRLRWNPQKTLEALLLLVGLVAIGLVVFLDWFPHPYVCLPILLWAAFRFGTRETASAAFILSGIAIWGTLRGSGPFAGDNTNESLLELQAFMVVSAVTAMCVAALVSERTRATRALRDAHDHLEQRVAERTEALSRLNEALRVEIDERGRAERELAEIARRRSEDLRDFAVSVQRAQEDERRRIARELHDDLGQRLSGLKLSLQVLEDDVVEGGMMPASRLQELGRDLDKMIVEVRRLSYNLRPAALDDFGPIAALQTLCNQFEKTHKVRTRFQANEPDDTRHGAHVEIALYRIAQEALSNVAKHARATTVSVQLTRHDSAIAVIVEDDGCGFDVNAIRAERKQGAGLGLVGMMERSQLLGGTFRVESTLRGGTRIEAHLPLDNSHR